MRQLKVTGLGWAESEPSSGVGSGEGAMVQQVGASRGSALKNGGFGWYGVVWWSQISLSCSILTSLSESFLIRDFRVQ
jgi:hypothetical protein